MTCLADTCQCLHKAFISKIGKSIVMLKITRSGINVIVTKGSVWGQTYFNAQCQPHFNVNL